MELIRELPGLLDEAKKEYESIAAGCFASVEEIVNFQGIACCGEDCIPSDYLAAGDNLSFMKYLLENGYRGMIKMIYVDPPFYTRSKYEATVKDPVSGESIKTPAYTDKWERGLPEYFRMLAVRLYAMKDLLSEDGSIWMHLDWHIVHYVKIIMDEIFGYNNFVNEIVWTYKSGGSGKHHFSRKHDTILYYAKSKNYYFKPQKEKSYNRGYKPYRFKGVEEFEDEMGWYTMVNMKDVWQIDMVGRTSGERTGYATQKPVALIERMMESCTEEGDICADFFCGSGTLAAAAHDMNRRFICCDGNDLAVSMAYDRLTGRRVGKEAGAEFLLLMEKRNAPDTAFYATEPDAPDEDNKTQVKFFRGEDGQILINISGFSGDVIDYWSVDPAYDGLVHRPSEYFYNSKTGFARNCSVIPVDGKVSVCIVDIYGKRSYFYYQ